MGSLTHYFVISLVTAGVSLLVLFAIFRPLEWAFPARRQGTFRPHFFTDLFFFLGQYLFFNGAVYWLLLKFQPYIHAATPAEVVNFVRGLHPVVQLLVVVLVGDLLIYWGHRLQHQVGFLWRFHAVHHSAEHLDWLAAHREHPLDSVYTILIVNLPIFALGFPIPALAGFAAFRGLWAIFIHSNTAIRLPVLRTVLGSPELHHWHHDRDRDAGNYANLSPLFDKLFGTYVNPGHEPEAFGLREPLPQSYWKQLLLPLLPGRLARRWLEERKAESAEGKD